MSAHFVGNGNGGATITRWDLGYGSLASGPQHVIASKGTSVVVGLLPGTMYYFWARGANSKGNGPWCAVRSARTIAGGYVMDKGVWKQAVPYVKVGGVWKLAQPYTKTLGVWRPTS